MKEDIKNILNKLSSLEITATNDRYKNENKSVPRVTEVISSMLHEEGLMNWSNSLGWKRISYRNFMKIASEKGTYSHLAIEKYLKDGYVDIKNFGIVDNNVFSSVNNCMNAFYIWWERLHQKYKNIEIVYLEEKLVGQYYGGTCDCLLKIDNKYVLIDFKTSNHMSYHYSLQLAAYRKLLKDLREIDIDSCMILQLDKLNGTYNEYILDMSNEDHNTFIQECEDTFLLLLSAFIMREYTTEKYYKIYGIEKYKK